MTSDERFAIEAYCTDCQNDTVLEYSWTAYELVQGKSQELKLWPNKTLTSEDLKYVVVKEDALRQNTTYILKVQVKGKGGKWASCVNTRAEWTPCPPKPHPGILCKYLAFLKPCNFGSF